LIANPANENEIFLYGGEYFNGATAHFYNDLFVYNIKRDTWNKVTSPNSPLPRSGHAWCRAANTQEIYLFGGEFSSPKQGTFYHYNDFWKLEPKSREWTRVETKGKASSPPARSGHRMVGFKQYIILFGGFQDTSATTKYLNDLWIYDCVNFTWHTPKLQAARAVPDARSSFTLLPHDQGAVIYGGYSRVKATVGGNKGQQQQQGKGKKGGGGGPASRNVLKPKVHVDTWFIRVTPPKPDEPSTNPPTVSWEKRKMPANAPNPARAGATMAFHKGRGVLFGGVHDVEESEEGIESEFFNQMFVWNIERNRYMPLTLRRPKANANRKADKQANVSRRARGKADEEELLANLKALEMKIGGATSQDSDDEADKVEEEEEDTRPEKPRIFEFPHPRFNAALAVQADTLYIYGGTFEKGDREFTFDELWSVNLNHLDGVQEIFRRELEDWQGSEDEADSEDEEDDEDDEEEEEDEDKNAPSTAPTSVTDSPVVVPSKDEDLGNQEEISALTDGLPHPRPFESLRDFYARTSETWINLKLEELDRKKKTDEYGVKEIRQLSFKDAEEKFWDCREEIRALEDEQEAAGIGEVVSLADKEVSSAGAGRRR
jgi:N-acetylneuraminic acid mutarotase